LPCTKSDEIGCHDGHPDPAEADRHPVVQIKKLIIWLEARNMNENMHKLKKTYTVVFQGLLMATGNLVATQQMVFCSDK
jgi:cobalamin biosynthesis protein CobD/CbiB